METVSIELTQHQLQVLRSGLDKLEAAARNNEMSMNSDFYMLRDMLTNLID